MLNMLMSQSLLICHLACYLFTVKVVLCYELLSSSTHFACVILWKFHCINYCSSKTLFIYIHMVAASSTKHEVVENVHFYSTWCFVYGKESHSTSISYLCAQSLVINASFEVKVCVYMLPFSTLTFVVTSTKAILFCVCIASEYVSLLFMWAPAWLAVRKRRGHGIRNAISWCHYRSYGAQDTNVCYLYMGTVQAQIPLLFW